MIVGSNGRVAWSQTQLTADVTDWYAESLRLGSDGLPDASFFRGEWRALSRFDETYQIADVPALGSVGRTEVFRRWVTFDGRWLFDVEGRALAVGEEPETVETVAEPFLVREGLVGRTPRGRVALPSAWSHLGLAPPQDPGTLFA